MRPQDIITKKRDGERLSEEEIYSFIEGVTNGAWADYQTTALIMAMFLKGLDSEEQTGLTRAMLESGEVLDLSGIDKPKADKHSTGGVGDKTSVIIAPIVAACGGAVPMISGRGLGHTGGTLDKLESIENFDVNLSARRFREIVRECGYAMAGQTAEIAPADKKIYALRDATATVPAIPLIVASIMSKKLAEGLDVLVLDVKTGSGAFMQGLAQSKKLAEALVATGNSFGVKTSALITDMNQPLGKFVGNALEIYECVKVLRGEADEKMKPMLEVTRELSAEMLRLTGLAGSKREASDKIKNCIESGKALEKLRQNIELQNGDPSICDDPEILISKDLLKFAIKAGESGFIKEIETDEIGGAVCAIGGGRTKAEDEIDHAVGYASLVGIGDEIKSGEELGVVYCRREEQFERVVEKLRNSYKICAEKPSKSELIKALIN